MLHWEIPDAQTARDFDTCHVLHAEHSFNASTFTARVVASTRARMFAEAQSKPALYRPSAEYIGRYCGSEGCKYIPIERRE